MLEEHDRQKALEVLRDHRQHLLSGLTSRNPLLRFTTQRGYREDALKLFSGIEPNLPATIPTGQNSWIPVTDLEQLLLVLLASRPGKIEIKGAADTVVAKCGKIIEQGRDWRAQTGQNSLYVGYPMLFVPVPGEKYIISPLYLWAVEISVNRNNIRIARLLDDDEPIRPAFNRLLNTWLHAKCNVRLFEQDVAWESRESAIQATVRDWTGLANDLMKPIRELPAPAQLKAWSTAKEDPRIIPSAVFGHCPFKGQARLDDLDKIIERVAAGETDLGILTRFVTPRPDQDEEKAVTPPESDSWLVSDSDISQESSIWQARNSKVVVVHGPPGTGKSQTIVNLVADAIKKKKKIAIVCEKEAALEVIQKRLVNAGLQELVIQIKEPGKDRATTIRRIKSNNEDLFTPVNGREQVCRSLDEAEALLAKVQTILTDDEARPIHGNLLARCERLEKKGVRPHDASQLERLLPPPVTLDNNLLGAIQANIAEIQAAIAHCDYLNNPWRESLAVAEVDGVALADTRETLREVETLVGSLPRASECYSERTGWLAENSMSVACYQALLDDETRSTYRSQLRIRQLVESLECMHSYTRAHMLSRRETLDRVQNLLQDHLRHVYHIPTVADVRKAISENELHQFLWQTKREQLDQWTDIVELAALRLWRRERERAFPLPPSISVEATRTKAASLSTQKRIANQNSVLGEYRQRVAPRNWLDDRNLTRLRTSPAVVRTEMRDIFYKGFAEFHDLFPILLTNPDTACSILPLEPGLYDLLIMDEASQVFMSDAIPVLFRAKTVVISGDQHQMPPSDYFMQGMADGNADGVDDDDEDSEELSGEVAPARADENRRIPAEGEYCLLDAAVFAVRVNSPANCHLQVHYRSDFPELIAFSNHAFYDGRLIVPSSNAEPLKGFHAPIVYRQVNGTFNNGVNIVEAQAVVNELKELLKDPNPPSIGVITFNVKQRDLIDDLLFKEANEDSEFRACLEAARTQLGPDGEDQSAFVRSVEHVQGHERELIIFSTTYGALSRNFGPLRVSEKGRRRLNVAISRAKRGIKIFSSLNLSEVAKEEDRDQREKYFLWKYLCYARAVSERRTEEAANILSSLNPQHDTSPRARTESPFEDDVRDFLLQKGYFVQPQIGELGFRIDLGVKLNGADSRYLAGIECDGRRWHSSWTARMNDIWRQNILEHKGWKIIRVWSTDWYGDGEECRRKLCEQLERLAQSRQALML